VISDEIVALFVQRQLGEHNILDDTCVIISKHISGIFKRHTHHTQLIYHRAPFISKAIFILINSERKEDYSLVFCHFQYQRIGAPLRKIRIPVVDCHVARQVA
jgi:hypothetical protein